MKTLLTTLFSLLAACICCASTFPPLERSFRTARIEARGDLLTVTTGLVTQQWKLVPGGLATVALNDNTGKAWCDPFNVTPDWTIYDVTEGSTANLVSLTASEDDDEGFTGRHLNVTVLFEYPQVGAVVQYVIRAYPDANGIFTRLGAKGDGARFVRKTNAPCDDRVVLEHANDRQKIRPASFEPLQSDWYESAACSPDSMLLAAAGLRPGKMYKATFTFWNGISAERIVQRIDFTCGGRTVTLAPHVEVAPSIVVGAVPTTLTVDIPPAVVTESCATFTLRSICGGASLASEVWISERSELPSVHDLLFASPSRRPEVLASLPAGYRLVGYNDLGTKTGILPQAPNGCVARLPIAASGAVRHYAGYYTDTQNRNTRDTPLLWETSCTGPIDGTERVAIASMLSVEKDGCGVLLLKESHKCVNQWGVDTGDFTIDSTGISNRGLGFSPADMTPDRFVTGWANWTILYRAGERASALKKFDRIRFPVRQLAVMSNTWGSDKRNPRYAARESNVLREIESARDLGIEIVQVDDGWQGITYDRWRPAATAELEHTGRYALYPYGWSQIRAAARKAGVALGLWFSWTAPEEDIIKNFDEGGFVSFKLDFAKLDTKSKLDALMRKARAVLLHAGSCSAVNWDLTEIAPRVGIYYGREYGNVYLENRRPELPARIVYVPYLVLRDAWHLSRYANLNQYQLPIQNVASVSDALSDACRYSQGYATAVALMGGPLFFCETRCMEERARREVRALLAVYKRERDRMARGYVSPIGSEPDNASWTGFHNRAEDGCEGYLMLFREANNEQVACRIRIDGCAGRLLRLTNLLGGEVVEKQADGRGCVLFEMPDPADYRFYRYELLDRNRP